VQVGEPILTPGRPDRTTIAAATAVLRDRLEALLADAPTVERPGRFGRWLSDAFNDWPEGSREATLAAAAAQSAEPAAGD
jgi:hypothetical protein